ncbi:hypothetical protein PCC8801_2655 [Rippkaea orientalis PCC 8801]|uniref:Uncharacterized protein n=1 Tax=Rippkaea orientalis (strain PCC 8801 / RF-1) TaxID=41431 RepID=B7K501_RIPO1|nr:hypothetical protein [Rippkaea orientalis]ACK66657.1 hypothetical protein PCC8801_2655 [Rippkaea orientalis PCC 8801]
MELQREFFPSVRKTIMPRPIIETQTDILGQKGTAWAVDAKIYGYNWYLDQEQGLIEIYDAGPALSFRHLLPRKDKYAKEGLYLRIKIAYRTTENANVNIRNFSGTHVTLPNSVEGDTYDDPNTYWWVTDDMTLNINSIFSEEKLWIQRVEWEWVSKEVIYDDELAFKDIFSRRSPEDVEKLYIPEKITDDSVKNFLVDKIQKDDHFAKRCLMLLRQDQLIHEDLVKLFTDTGIEL